jgi:hypothetical protein
MTKSTSNGLDGRMKGGKDECTDIPVTFRFVGLANGAGLGWFGLVLLRRHLPGISVRTASRASCGGGATDLGRSDLAERSTGRVKCMDGLRYGVSRLRHLETHLAWGYVYTDMR